MRYFLDTEFNGFAGALLSLALVPDEGEELYLKLAFEEAYEPWVERHVAAEAVAYYLRGDPEPLIVADWPEDIAQFSMLLLTGPGTMIDVPPLTFRLLPLPGFSTAANSAVPHNALHDARALRDHVLSHLE